jgi:2-polyprenyl-3-methyl-5-hydroxy-6-metoxy-1,4-benzoquinol methylase
MMNQEIRLCPICGFSNGFQKKSKAINLYARCDNCNSIYSKCIASRKEIADYYASYYSNGNLSIPSFIYGSLKSTVSTFSKYRTAKGNLCDFGFGAGAMLQVAHEDGWHCSGTEYSMDAIRLGKASGWEVHFGDLDVKDLPGPFDVITIIETLEHVQDPSRLIEEASIRLRRGGLIYGTTPNGLSLNARLLGEKWSVMSFPEHPILLSRQALLSILAEAGFTGIEIKSRGFNPYDLLKFARGKVTSRNEMKTTDLGRVQLGYELVETISKNIFLRFIRDCINVFLSIFNSGDSLVFRAVKL